nr:M23 family metallopeptidase [Lysobacter enzymogenes]
MPSESIALAVPLTNTRITSRYGVTGGIRVRPHRGLDFAARRGTRVYAPAAALVVAATDRYPEGERYGKVVVLDHGDGWQTLYAHLQDFDVHEGQRIAAGAPIGRSGASGQATGPHLHMEVLHDGQRVDPEPLLR